MTCTVHSVMHPLTHCFLTHLESIRQSKIHSLFVLPNPIQSSVLLHTAALSCTSLHSPRTFPHHLSLFTYCAIERSWDVTSRNALHGRLKTNHMTCQEAEVHRVQEGDKVVELLQLENMFRPDVSFSLALWPIPSRCLQEYWTVFICPSGTLL